MGGNVSKRKSKTDAKRGNRNPAWRHDEPSLTLTPNPKPQTLKPKPFPLTMNLKPSSRHKVWFQHPKEKILTNIFGSDRNERGRKRGRGRGVKRKGGNSPSGQKPHLTKNAKIFFCARRKISTPIVVPGLSLFFLRHETENNCDTDKTPCNLCKTTKSAWHLPTPLGQMAPGHQLLVTPTLQPASSRTLRQQNKRACKSIVCTTQPVHCQKTSPSQQRPSWKPDTTRNSWSRPTTVRRPRQR